jgi:hypothetical protein
MQAGFELNTAVSDCQCCRFPTESSDSQYGCSDRSTVLTPREQEVLDRIRAASERARELKQSLRRSSYDGQNEPTAYAGTLEELENLRKMRTELEEERVAAADERMRMLGHLN